MSHTFYRVNYTIMYPPRFTVSIVLDIKHLQSNDFRLNSSYRVDIFTTESFFILATSYSQFTTLSRRGCFPVALISVALRKDKTYNVLYFRFIKPCTLEIQFLGFSCAVPYHRVVFTRLFTISVV